MKDIEIEADESSSFSQFYVQIDNMKILCYQCQCCVRKKKHFRFRYCNYSLNAAQFLYSFLFSASFFHSLSFLSLQKNYTFMLLLLLFTSIVSLLIISRALEADRRRFVTFGLSRAIFTRVLIYFSIKKKRFLSGIASFRVKQASEERVIT
jgi:hypothetical protein